MEGPGRVPGRGSRQGVGGGGGSEEGREEGGDRGVLAVTRQEHQAAEGSLTSS